MYSFEEASRMVEDLTHGHGKQQNDDCLRMKEELMGMGVDGSGLVSLRRFYMQPEVGDTADFSFAESVDYLRQIGALDESAPEVPQVRIANYLLGPSNCRASSTYFHVCCMSECDGLMNELEQDIRAPVAPVEQLIDLVSNLSSSSVDAPRALPEDLSERLSLIADRHGGVVPL